MNTGVKILLSIVLFIVASVALTGIREAGGRRSEENLRSIITAQRENHNSVPIIRGAILP